MQHPPFGNDRGMRLGLTLFSGDLPASRGPSASPKSPPPPPKKPPPPSPPGRKQPLPKKGPPNKKIRARPLAQQNARPRKKERSARRPTTIAQPGKAPQHSLPGGKGQSAEKASLATTGRPTAPVTAAEYLPQGPYEDEGENKEDEERGAFWKRGGAPGPGSSAFALYSALTTSIILRRLPSKSPALNLGAILSLMTLPDIRSVSFPSSPRPTSILTFRSSLATRIMTPLSIPFRPIS